MPNRNHHICIHGHFYQPPRENPWLGVIERQPSAFPHHDWNERIAAECYAALASSPVRDSAGGIRDMYNCYAHLSLNVGPTLFAWLERNLPELLPGIAAGDRLHAGARGGHPGALAQPYSHPILPLQPPRDRRTQIVWGIREFEHRFGRLPLGMWLPECAVNMDTVRALIDHGIKFTILSPYQCSKVRAFGQEEWRDVSDGGPDTRVPYRIFEVDGAGRTHFNRHLDVFFYDPGLSMKISFEHLLKRPVALRAELGRRFDRDANLPQLALIATDGEIYGHHEPGGEEALARVFAETAPEMGLYVSNLEQYLAENPPASEARLWDGEDGKGSSWSCGHGVGRWHRDCGCRGGGPEHWRQEWRSHLRGAFDRLAQAVAAIFEREGARYFTDPWEARDDYISVLLHDNPEARAGFLARHAAGNISEEARVCAWELLEASRNAMLMYTSCGWFFDDLAGIEPVQNMRYALRAAELAQPYAEADLTALLREGLGRGRSNREGVGTGADIFDREVLPSRYGPERLAAAHVLPRMAGLHPGRCLAAVEDEMKEERRAGDRLVRRGLATVTDRLTGRRRRLAYVAALWGGAGAGAIFPGGDSAEEFARALKLKDSETADFFAGGVGLRDLPREAREGLLAVLKRKSLLQAERGLDEAYAAAAPLLEAYAASRLEPPAHLRSHADTALSQRLLKATLDTLEAKSALSGVATVLEVYAEAERTWATADRREPGREICLRFEAALRTALRGEGAVRNLERCAELLEFADRAALPLDHLGAARREFWDFLQNRLGQELAAGRDANRLRELCLAVGLRLGFTERVMRDRGC